MKPVVCDSIWFDGIAKPPAVQTPAGHHKKKVSGKHVNF